MYRAFNNLITSRRIASIYRIDPQNIGDLISSPIHYFPFLSQARQLDLFAEAKEPTIRLSGLVLGGGGCIGHSPWVKLLETYAESSITSKVAWGAGQNIHDSTAVDFPVALDKFNHVGLRDYPNPWRWTPCPSCLHPAFDRKHEVQHPFVFFEQSLFSPIDSGKHPKMSNTVTDMEQIISFLGSGDTVFSSSYHGVYWATLLGRKAVAVNPFSSKFYRLRFPVPMISTNEWASAANDAVSYPDALRLSREANISFAEDVWNDFVIKGIPCTRDSQKPVFELQKPRLQKSNNKAKQLSARAFGKAVRIAKRFS